MIERIHAKFTGQVQGVGFRFTVENLSGNFKISGYVKNLSSGSVEVVAEGEKAELNQFLEAILSSRLKSYISNHTVDWSEAQDSFSGFGIQY